MRRVFFSLFVLVVFACDDLDEFRVRGDEIFAGPVLGSDSPDSGTGNTGCEFVLCGFAERTTLTLTEFDPAVAGGPMTQGRIRTSDNMFDNAALLPIPGLEHDALSQYTFPGGGRVRNFMFGARFGDNNSRYAIVFVSLMEDGRIEVRVHAPGEPPDDNGALFGVFRLCRGGCAP